MKAQAIFIEAGHGKSNGLLGGKDTGAVGVMDGKRITEREFTVMIADAIFKIMKSKDELKNIIVQDVGIHTEASISKKMQYVNSVIAKNGLNPLLCFGVAIHMNSSTDHSANGFEVWYQKNGRSMHYADYIARSWKEYGLTQLRPRPINNSKDGRYGKFYIDDTRANYVIVETAFVSNSIEAKKISQNIPRVAEAIAHGILEYIRSLS